MVVVAAISLGVAASPSGSPEHGFVVSDVQVRSMGAAELSLLSFKVLNHYGGDRRPTCTVLVSATGRTLLAETTTVQAGETGWGGTILSGRLFRAGEHRPYFVVSCSLSTNLGG
jgi:hypothetical protein